MQPNKSFMGFIAQIWTNGFRNRHQGTDKLRKLVGGGQNTAYMVEFMKRKANCCSYSSKFSELATWIVWLQHKGDIGVPFQMAMKWVKPGVDVFGLSLTPLLEHRRDQLLLNVARK
ncbi:MAG: hypothetical protein RLZZ444_2796 [Pseudomonadota bacterium]